MTSRLITLFLVLNVALAFWALALDRTLPWPAPGQTPAEPDRVALQVRPESIRIVSEMAPAPAHGPASPASAAEPASPAASAAPAANTGSGPGPMNSSVNAPLTAPVNAPAVPRSSTNAAVPAPSRAVPAPTTPSPVSSNGPQANVLPEAGTPTVPAPPAAEASFPRP